ncbi:MBL fold metallo-hydrolase [Dechloromonas sp. HYN0024]|uniref:MBL fold metallo-hydrolase n=1 Tax=Dechloromonas sp. HYN0024 TaxID=2231055 RepID=UPI000E4321EE|nr:MBL fold metallo-hydrolase [Dechloromonas sp. HYN0024]AXS81578.1 MBL fold metallo-hydrolase [Dechloromonas sp. HYN0024]
MDRRDFLRSVAAISALWAVEFAPWQSMSAFASEMDDFVRGPAIKDYPLRQVSKHVSIIFTPHGFPTPDNQGMMSNITFVNTSKGVVVIDTGASVQIGEMAIRQLEKNFRKPVVAIINTHYHGDHWLGNHAYVERYGNSLPMYAHAGTIQAVKGIQGSLWLSLIEKATNEASLGTRIVPPNMPLEHGAELRFGDVTLRIHHYGKVHTPSDLCVEVVEDGVTLVGDIAMNQRIANMDDGSYLGTFKAYDALEKSTRTKIWLPAHGVPAANVLAWNRALFEGIYYPCEQAIKDGLPLEEAKTLVLKDKRVASQAKNTKGFEANIGKYVSIAYLEAEAAGF